MPESDPKRPLSEAAESPSPAKLIPAPPPHAYRAHVLSDRGGFARHRGPEGIAGFASRTVAGSSGAEVPTSHRPNRQASALAGRPSGADPQIPVRGAGQREVVAVRHHRHRNDIGTQPSTANAARLRASPGCSSPKPRRPGLDGAFGTHPIASRTIAPDTRRQRRSGRHCQARARQCPAARGRRALRQTERSQSTFRSPAAVLPRSVFNSNETFCPSVSVIMPASFTAVMCTNTSLPPSAG